MARKFRWPRHVKWRPNTDRVGHVTRRCAGVDERRSATQRLKQGAYRLSRLALLADHIHLALRPGYTESPQSVALSTMNNLAYAHGGKWALAFSYYAGTIGEFDLEAIRRSYPASEIE